jgi:hypothetical protein
MIEPVYRQLREKVLHISGTKNHPPSQRLGGAWGLLMDLGYEKYFVTVLALSDGKASLYLSTGGGALAASQEERDASPLLSDLWRSAKVAVSVADDSIAGMRPMMEYPLPDPGSVTFYVLTDTGIYGAMARQEDFKRAIQPLTTLYAAAQRVITEFRLAEAAGAFKKSLRKDPQR